MNQTINYKNMAISLFLYLILAGIGAWRVLVMLKTFYPGLSAAGYLGGYALMSTALPLGFFLPHSRISKMLDIIGNYWVCFQLTFFFTAMVEWLVKLAAVNLLRAFTAEQFAGISLLLFSLSAIVTVYGIIHARIIHLTKYQCQVDKPCFQDEMLRIVHLSDLHLGSINNLNEMRKIVVQVNAMCADVICITGDTFTENVHDVFDIDGIAEVFCLLESRYGVYACLGNHDAGSEFPQMLEFFRRTNIHLLYDEYVQLDNIILLGRSDMTPGGNLKNERKPIEDCLKGADLDKLVIVLDHQPGDLKSAMTAGADLLLSGHTHGGQFFPIHRMIRRIFPHYCGCKQFGQMYSIVSSGTCMAIPPIRIGSRSEIVEITVFNNKS